jgi:hypothetical protein
MYGLQQIRPLLRKLEDQGVDCVVAGGFAVFLWAERYARTDARYLVLEPFTSVDLDLIGDRDEAIAIGRALSVKPKLNPGTDPGPNAGTLLVPGVGGRDRLRIDVLTGVFGCTYPEAFSSAQPFSFPDGTSTKVLDPFLCLQSKVLNLLSLDQKTRRDQPQTKIAILNLENRIRELIKSDIPGADREVLHVTERTFRLALSGEGQQVAKKFGVTVETAVPTDLFSTGGEKLAKFAERRLPQLIEKLKTKRSRIEAPKHSQVSPRYVPRNPIEETPPAPGE